MPRQRANKSAIRALAELNGTNYTTALRAFEADERALAALILDNMPSDPETAGPRTPDPGPRTPEQASPSLDVTFTD